VIRPRSFALTALLFLACASPTSLDGVVEASVRAQCHFAFACCTAPERATFLSSSDFRDEGTCVSESLEQGSELDNIVARAKAVVAKKKGAFDEARAQECLQPVFDAQNSCDADVVFGGGFVGDGRCDDDAARGFVTGNVKDGGACDDDIECADFGTCDTSGGDAGVVTTKGKCRAAKGEGEDCSGAGDRCTPGTACAAADSGGSTCQTPELADDGERCASGTDCKGKFCVPKTVRFCDFSQTACDVDADCADFGETCVESRDLVCASESAKVEACDGL
jgi:hypothetical protein